MTGAISPYLAFAFNSSGCARRLFSLSKSSAASTFLLTVSGSSQYFSVWHSAVPSDKNPQVEGSYFFPDSEVPVYDFEIDPGGCTGFESVCGLGLVVLTLIDNGCSNEYGEEERPCEYGCHRRRVGVKNSFAVFTITSCKALHCRKIAISPVTRL